MIGVDPFYEKQVIKGTTNEKEKKDNAKSSSFIVKAMEFGGIALFIIIILIVF